MLIVVVAGVNRGVRARHTWEERGKGQIQATRVRTIIRLSLKIEGNEEDVVKNGPWEKMRL